jgi:hypothetical protein
MTWLACHPSIILALDWLCVRATVECARRIVPCPFACGGSYPEEDVPEHKVSIMSTVVVDCVVDCRMCCTPSSGPLEPHVGAYIRLILLPLLFVLLHRLYFYQAKTCVKRLAKPIPCPNKCGLKFIGTYDRVRDIEFEVAEHVREHCEARMISCDFNGCFDSMKASERRSHRARHLRGEWRVGGYR